MIKEKIFTTKQDLKQWLRSEFNKVVGYKFHGYDHGDYVKFANHLARLKCRVCVKEYEYDTNELLELL